MAKTEFGPDCVKPSSNVSADVGTRIPEGILGKPIVSNGMTTAVKRSDNSGKPSMTHDINVANDAARRSGTVFMPTGTKR